MLLAWQRNTAQTTFDLCEWKITIYGTQVSRDSTKFDKNKAYLEITADSVIYHKMNLTKFSPPKNNGVYNRTSIAIKDIKLTDITKEQKKTLWLFHHKNGNKELIKSPLITETTYFCDKTEKTLHNAVMIECESEVQAKDFLKTIKSLINR